MRNFSRARLIAVDARIQPVAIEPMGRRLHGRHAAVRAAQPMLRLIMLPRYAVRSLICARQAAKCAHVGITGQYVRGVVGVRLAAPLADRPMLRIIAVPNQRVVQMLNIRSRLVANRA